MRRPAVRGTGRVVPGSGTRQDDRGSRARHGDQKAEQDTPDPVAWIPAELLLPGEREPPEDTPRGPQPVAALEAVLLIGAVAGTATGTDRCFGRPRRGAHCFQRSCGGAGSASSSSA